MNGPEAGKVFVIRDSVVLGRDDSADIVLGDATGQLSRRHARIATADGAVIVEDLESTNGTFLNGERVHGRHLLTAGDLIRIGSNTLEFAPAVDSQLTGPHQAAQTTRPRTVPSDLTRPRDIRSDVTRARQIPSDLTRPRHVAIYLTSRLRAIASEPTSAAAEAPPVVERPPTYAPTGADGQLQILSGPGAGEAAPVMAGSATVGREPECDLQVLDSEVSRRHAKVTIRDGIAVIDDLHSANGTYVNGERILGPRQLSPADRIQIGEATIALTTPVFEGSPPHVLPPQPTGIGEAIADAPRLLAGESGNRKWWTLAVVLTTTFMLLLDITIVAVALPSISNALHPSFTSLQWIVDAYTLMLTAVLLTAGSLADLFGRKLLLTIGLIIFALASVACAQSPNATFLNFARGVQGIGGAIMFACSLALIVQEFPAKERAIAFGLYGAVNGLSVAIGPIAGGLLTEHIGWQAIFYLNVPIAIVAFIVLQRKVVNLQGPTTKVDWGGLVTFSIATFLAVYATIRGNTDGWTSALILSCYGASVVLAAAFVFIERRREFPMFDLTLFRNPTFIGSSISAIAVTFSLLGLIFFLTTWIQSVLGYSPVQAGVRMLVLSGAGMISGPIGGRASETVSPRIVLPIALGLVAAGVLAMTGLDANSTWTAILPGLVLSGLGLGLIGPTLASTAVGVVPPWRGGMASGMNSTCREFGTTAGLAVLGAVVAHQITVHVNNALSGSFLAGSAKSIGNAISVGATQTVLKGFNATQRIGLSHVARESYAAGLNRAFVVSGAVAIFGMIAAIVLVRKKHLRADAVAGH
ncbi:MAG: DHA2 family efflux MFS transporter permease subunit [Solirubrobacterales bacterium]|nr:DHA2 family efflux MFS transporter permease subunit [Solirubrobacterales bacterium]